MNISKPISNRLARVPELVMARRRALASAVCTRRKELKLSQQKLAEKSGIDRQTINRLENSAFSMSIDSLYNVSVGLDMRMSELFQRVELILSPEVVDLEGPPADEAEI